MPRGRGQGCSAVVASTKAAMSALNCRSDGSCRYIMWPRLVKLDLDGGTRRRFEAQMIDLRLGAEERRRQVVEAVGHQHAQVRVDQHRVRQVGAGVDGRQRRPARDLVLEVPRGVGICVENAIGLALAELQLAMVVVEEGGGERQGGVFQRRIVLGVLGEQVEGRAGEATVALQGAGAAAPQVLWRYRHRSPALCVAAGGLDSEFSSIQGCRIRGSRYT